MVDKLNLGSDGKGENDGKRASRRRIKAQGGNEGEKEQDHEDTTESLLEMIANFL